VTTRARGAWGGLLGLFVACSVPMGAGAQAPEAGRALDAGSAAEAGTPFGTESGGALDAGSALDANGALDAGGARDAGGALDAGSALDAGGARDAGATAASDAADGGAGDGSAAPTAPALPTEPSTTEVLRTLLGLLGLLALAWAGGHPRVRRLEERLGLTQVVTSGLPFVLLGLLMHAPGVDVLSDAVLGSITPLLQFGLGWIGFHTGFQFEGRAMDRVPRGTGSVVVLLTSLPFLFVAASAAALLWSTGLFEAEQLADDAGWTTLARDACLLGLAGALSAPVAGTILGLEGKQPRLAATIAVLDDVFGVLALLVLSAWLRPAHDHDWQLPPVGWLFVTLGLAGTLGLVVHFALLTAESAGERISLLLGSVAFTAGLAGYASISPLVVCFVAGLVLRNLPGGDKAAFEAGFTRLERPIYLLFLTIAGALWHLDDSRGWLLLVAFVAARLAGRALGARLSRALPDGVRPESLARTSDRELVLAPMGQLAIALVVAAQTLYESQAIRAIVTAVIGGSIVSEALVRFALPRAGGRSAGGGVPPDDDGYLVVERRPEAVATDPAPRATDEEAP
jgi:hypothetical protein